MNSFVKHILAVKLSALSIGTACYFTYVYHTPIERGMDTLLYRKISVQEGFFRDPHGVGIERTINEHGKREVYVKHEPSGLRYGLGEDGYPNYSNVFEQISNEVKLGKINTDNIKKYLVDVQQLEYLLNNQIIQKRVILSSQK